MKVRLDAYTLRESKLSFEETLDWVIAYRLERLQVSEKAFSHTTEAEIAYLAQRSADTVPPEGRPWSRERSDGVLIRTSGCGGSCDSAR